MSGQGKSASQQLDELEHRIMALLAYSNDQAQLGRVRQLFLQFRLGTIDAFALVLTVAPLINAWPDSPSATLALSSLVQKKR